MGSGLKIMLNQGIDGFAHEPPLKLSYRIQFRTIFGLFWGLFNASINHLKKNDSLKVAVNSRYFQSGQKVISFGQKLPQKTYHLSPDLGPFGGYLMPLIPI